MIDLIYDGQCGFCRQALRLVRRLDSLGRLRFHDATLRDAVLRGFPELATADLTDAMFVVDSDRHAYRGFFAFRRLMWESPVLWPLLLLFYAPGTSLIGPRIYAWVARNRRRFGCESDVCALPSRPDR